ncbi:MAG: AAA-like domain-containing protein [Deltaproteobacteria bacterium]|jgi:hypothetical protein|nr:AAA-like domain-containing protein [Deltaproteobacteria bacterium]
MLPVLPRIPDVDKMIEGEFYFIIHAPRESGKTTYLQYLTKQINLSENYYALYCSLEALDGIIDRNEAINEIIFQLHDSIVSSEIDKLIQLSLNYMPKQNLGSTTKIKSLLNYLCVNLDKELILFFDEADCLAKDPLITFLRQIRLGYNTRISGDNRLLFPKSMALIGSRDISDYIKKSRPDEDSRGLASPFNIKKDALTLANFTKDEIGFLYRRHTIASGQIFESEAVDRAWYWSKGQPWLVNALAYEIVVKILNNDYAKTITADLMDHAAEAIIKNRTTHIEYLKERLKEPRVIKVMDSVFAGATGFVLNKSDDRRYCLDLGLVVEDEDNNLRPANAIYSEVMSRLLSDEIQLGLDATPMDKN